MGERHGQDQLVDHAQHGERQFAASLNPRRRRLSSRVRPAPQREREPAQALVEGADTRVQLGDGRRSRRRCGVLRRAVAAAARVAAAAVAARDTEVVVQRVEVPLAQQEVHSLTVRHTLQLRVDVAIFRAVAEGSVEAGRLRLRGGYLACDELAKSIAGYRIRSHELAPRERREDAEDARPVRRNRLISSGRQQDEAVDLDPDRLRDEDSREVDERAVQDLPAKSDGRGVLLDEWRQLDALLPP
eukprot:7198744-Prymnesium_polylepis.1